jgi:hypothetical protein
MACWTSAKATKTRCMRGSTTKISYWWIHVHH